MPLKKKYLAEDDAMRRWLVFLIAIGLFALVQGAALLVLLVNRELLAQRLLPLYGIETRHPLFHPWFGSRPA